jgi:hypothetical protein
VTVKCSSPGTSASTSSTTHYCTSTRCATNTCTFSNGKPCVISYRSYKKVNVAVCLLYTCSIVIHRVPVNLIN